MLTDQQKEKITALLSHRGYERLSLNPGIWVNGMIPNMRLVDLSVDPPVVCISDGVNRVSDGHGLLDLDDLKQEIDGILASKALQSSCRKLPQQDSMDFSGHTPAPDTLPKEQVDNSLAPMLPSPANCQPERKVTVDNKGKRTDESFGALLDKGWSKEQLIKRFCLSDFEFERVLGALNRIRGVV